MSEKSKNLNNAELKSQPKIRVPLRDNQPNNNLTIINPYADKIIMMLNAVQINVNAGDIVDSILLKISQWKLTD